MKLVFRHHSPCDQGSYEALSFGIWAKFEFANFTDVLLRTLGGLPALEGPPSSSECSKL